MPDELRRFHPYFNHRGSLALLAAQIQTILETEPDATYELGARDTTSPGYGEERRSAPIVRFYRGVK
jgi:hypothetical protein